MDTISYLPISLLRDLVLYVTLDLLRDMLITSLRAVFFSSSGFWYGSDFGYTYRFYLSSALGSDFGHTYVFDFGSDFGYGYEYG